MVRQNVSQLCASKGGQLAMGVTYTPLDIWSSCSMLMGWLVNGRTVGTVRTSSVDFFGVRWL